MPTIMWWHLSREETDPRSLQRVQECSQTSTGNKIQQRFITFPWHQRNLRHKGYLTSIFRELFFILFFRNPVCNAALSVAFVDVVVKDKTEGITEIILKLSDIEDFRMMHITGKRKNGRSETHELGEQILPVLCNVFEERIHVLWELPLEVALGKYSMPRHLFEFVIKKCVQGSLWNNVA